MNPKDTSQKRKIITVTIVAVILMVVLQVVLLMLPDKKDDTTSPNTNTNHIRTLNYQGFGTLSEHGFTATQMEGIRYAFYKSSATAEEYIIDTTTIDDAAYDSDNPTPTTETTFVIFIDSKKFKAHVDKYTDFVTVNVTVNDAATNKVTYTSGPIDASKIDTHTSQNLGD